MKVVKGFYLLLSVCLVMGLVYGRKFVPAGECITLLTIDPALSPQEQQAITVWLEPYLLHALPQGLGELKKQFLSVSSVSVSHLADDRQEIIVQGIAPLARINNDTVLCRQGTVVPADAFQASVVQQLPQIFVKNPPRVGAVCEPLLAFVQQMQKPLFDRFTVYWHNDSEVWFSDKQEPHFTIVSTGAAVPSDNQIAQCLHAYHVMKNEAKKGTPGSRVLTDVRFHKQIIAYHKNEGG